MLDGLPGAGKSTQGQWLHDLLLKQGYDAHFYREADPENPTSFFELEIAERDFLVYLQDAEAYMQTSLDRWQAFVDEARLSHRIMILENMPCRNTVGFWLQAEVAEAAIMAFARQLRAVVAPLDPAVIYFRQDDASAALSRVLAARRDSFRVELFHNMGRFPFCQSRNLKDEDCLRTLWAQEIRLMQQILPDFAPYYLEVDIVGSQWAAYQQAILRFLNLV